MTKMFARLKNSRIKNTVKKILCAILIVGITLQPIQVDAMAKRGGLFDAIGKTIMFVTKEKIKDNKKKVSMERRAKEKVEKEEMANKSIGLFNANIESLTHEDLIALSNMLDYMLDGCAKDIKGLTRKQLENRVRQRLKNKRLTKKQRKDVKDFIEKRVVASLMYGDGKASVTILPSGGIQVTTPTPILAY